MLNHRSYIIIFILTVLIFNSFFIINLNAKEKQRVAVLNIAPKGVPETKIRIIRSALEEYIYMQKNLELVQSDEINRLLKKLDIKNVSNMDDALKVSNIISSDYVLLGDLSGKNNAYRLTVKLVSKEAKEVRHTYTKNFSSMEESNRISEEIAIKISRDLSQLNTIFSISLNAHYLYPIGFFSDTVTFGYGFTLEGKFRSILFENFGLGIASGYFQFLGSESSPDDAFIVPFLLRFSYDINLYKNFSISPIIGGGYSLVKSESGKTIGEPITELGINFYLTLTSSLKGIITFKHNILYEQDGIVNFLNLSLGVEYPL